MSEKLTRNNKRTLAWLALGAVLIAFGGGLLHTSDPSSEPSGYDDTAIVTNSPTVDIVKNWKDIPAVVEEKTGQQF